MTRPDANELAGILWHTNRPDAGELTDQPEAMQEVYARAADAAIGWFVGGSIDPLSVLAELTDDLAEMLAFRYNKPGYFADGIREIFDRYAEIVGEENLSDEVRKARLL